MIPYHDENATLRTPVITFALVGANVAAWLLLQGAGAERALGESVCTYGLIAGELTMSVPAGVRVPIGDGMACVTETGPNVANVFTSMFMHGSWMHLIGNMWFLWLFGNNVEDAMTRMRFIVFYLLSGIGAVAAQVLFDPQATVPMVGASGAISGVMGAYLVLFPRVRVYTLVPLGFFITTIALPAWAMLIYWMFLQLVGGLGRIGAEEAGGVAFWAHVGGFVAGLILVKVFASSDHVRRHEARRWEPRRQWR